ncbi:hypothetical protein [Neptunitalea lumnitzerae]|uniref:Glycosyltransferase family 1 protein n=1 Tax=Neptunitalea lumnitzerae TaxID=2965509 RepID=A0ABQ5MH09_9FLAO|nr:hypothetical protein [Neptunitalea sp. Y10]GLB48207.1 hypothetical protein Y10_05750 [Neptunitalea sp. Y10]
MPTPAKVYIDPRSRILYASFYIQGLYEVFGKQQVSFSAHPFTALDKDNEAFSFEHYFAFVIDENGTEKRYIVDFCDPPDISKNAYQWCHAYAKINFNPAETAPQFLEKLVHIPPSFGIRIWSAPKTALMAITNYIRCKKAKFQFPKKYFKDYYHQHKRNVLADYQNTLHSNSNKKPYVFMIASLWKDENCVAETNERRHQFMRICKQLPIIFEGGFWATPEHPQYKTYKEDCFDTPYPTTAYIAKTKASYMVFNTPAVHFCHGWKLGEYLAMGKAIITTPLYNKLPKALPCIEINDEASLKKAIQTLIESTATKNQLEKEATEYYLNYVQPKAVIAKLVL